MEYPAWCSGGRRPLIARWLSLQRLGVDLYVTRPVCHHQDQYYHYHYRSKAHGLVELVDHVPARLPLARCRLQSRWDRILHSTATLQDSCRGLPDHRSTNFSAPSRGQFASQGGFMRWDRKLAHLGGPQVPCQKRTCGILACRRSKIVWDKSTRNRNNVNNTGNHIQQVFIGCGKCFKYRGFQRRKRHEGKRIPAARLPIR